MILLQLASLDKLAPGQHFAFVVGYGHSSGLPPLEAPGMIAEKRILFFSYLLLLWLYAQRAAPSFVVEQPVWHTNPIAASLHHVRIGVGNKHQHDAACSSLLYKQ